MTNLYEVHATAIKEHGYTCVSPPLPNLLKFCSSSLKIAGSCLRLLPLCGHLHVPYSCNFSNYWPLYNTTPKFLTVLHHELVSECHCVVTSIPHSLCVQVEKELQSVLQEWENVHECHFVVMDCRYLDTINKQWKEKNVSKEMEKMKRVCCTVNSRAHVVTLQQLMCSWP